MLAAGLAALWALGGASALPDLTVSVSGPPGALDLDTVSITVTLANGGDVASSNTTVELAIDGTPIDPAMDFGPVSAGGALTRTASFVLSCGVHDLGATADPLDNVAESNESNNGASGQASVVPVASFSATVTDLSDGHQLSLNASGSHGCRPLAFSWAVTAAGSATGETASVLVPAGNVTVTLRATSLANTNLVGISTRTVSVRNIPPTVQARFPLSPQPSGLHSGLFVEAVDVDGEVTSYAFDMGDGNHTALLAEASNHVYREAGTYEVEVVVTDNLGATGSTTATVVILNRPPRAAASLAYWYGEQAHPVVLDALNSSDPEGGGLTYSWNFGDGATGSGPVANHTYSAPAVYVVTLTVTDADGGTSNATVQVTILPQAAGPSGLGSLWMVGIVVFVAVLAVMYVATERRIAQQEGGKPRKNVPGRRDPAAGQPRGEEE